MAGSQDDFEDRGPGVFATCIATLAVSTAFFSMRMASRLFVVKKITNDDIVMACGWLVSVFLTMTVCLAATHGLGRRDRDIDPGDFPNLRRSEYSFSVLYNAALGLVKSSILVFYIRIAGKTQVVLRYMSMATLVVVVLTAIATTLVSIFQCSPVDASWDLSITTFTCIPLLSAFICASPVNIITNLIILAAPIPVLSRMQLPTRQRVILVATFGLGVFTTIVDVIRIYYLQTAISRTLAGSSTNPQPIFGGQEDFPYTAAYSLMWSVVEVNVYCICGNVVQLKPIILKILPRILRHPDDTKTSYRESETQSSQRRSVPSYPSPSEDHHHDSDGQGDGPVSAMEFLTTAEPGQVQAPSDADDAPARARTNMTDFTMPSLPRRRSVFDFGFVNMNKTKSMVKATNAESFKYCTVVAVLFLLWGVSYGFLNTLNSTLASINGFSSAETVGLTSAYFGIGYFFGPLVVGEWILRRDEHTRSVRHQRDGSPEHVGGYKVTFITGLAIYGAGTIIFWPCAVTGSWGGFMFSNAVVGFGLSILEVGANSFMVLCGPADYADMRLLIAQGVQGVGTVLSSLLAQKVLFNDIADDQMENSRTLVNVQWTYLGITLLCALLALFFYYVPLPEVTEAELDEEATKLPVDVHKKGMFGWELRTWSLALAVIAQYMYVGAQECNSIYFRSLLLSFASPSENGASNVDDDGASQSVDPATPAALYMAPLDYLSIGLGAFALSRFMAAYLVYLSVHHPRLPKPRTILTTSVAMCILFAILTAALRPSNPNVIAIPIILGLFAEGPLWPLIYSQGMRGQGRRSKRAAAYITMGASGPPAPLFIMFAIIEGGARVSLAFIVVVVLQTCVIALPLFLDLNPDARKMVDPKIRGREADEEEITTDIKDEEKKALPNGLDKVRHGSANETQGGSSSQGEIEHEEQITPSKSVHG